MLDYSDEQKNTPCPKVDCRPKEKCCSAGFYYTQIPAALGDDSGGSEFAPTNGAYVNRIVEYEANGHVYLYGSDGIPVQISIGIEELDELVKQYFADLDIQDEVDKKIDQMVEDGTFASLFIGDGLEVDQNGKTKVKAGIGITVDGNGVSETPYVDYLPIDIHETIYTNTTTDTNTTINYAIVSSDYIPEIIMSDPNNPNIGKRASEIDYLYSPTLMVNLSAWNTSTHETYGPIIIDGDIKVQNNLGGASIWTRPIVAIDNGGYLHNIDGSVSASEVNYPNAFRAWQCLYNDGSENPLIGSESHEPRTFLAQDSNGNFLVGVCGGRKVSDTGMVLADIIDFILNALSFSAVLIFNLDGGGSSNFLYHGIRQNRLVNREDRACPNWLVFRSKTAKHDGLFKNQSVNNLENYKQDRRSDGHLQTLTEIGELYEVGENVTLNANTRIYEITPRCITYNINFNVTGENNLPAYSYILKNIPRPYGTVMFPIYNIETNTFYRGYLHRGTDVGNIRNRDSLPPGNYQINIVAPFGVELY